MRVFLKYFSIIICYIYSACILSQVKTDNKKKISVGLYSVIMSLMMSVLSENNKYMVVVLIFVITTFILFFYQWPQCGNLINA